MFRPLLLILALCFSLRSLSQDKLDYSFNHLDQSSGFPAKIVRKIAKDKHGLLWMLTDKGLMRYNGHTAKFYPPTKDSSGYLNFPPLNIYIDKEGIIWLSYLELCISSFDPKTETFAHYFHDEKDPGSFPPGGAAHFMEDKRGDLWIAVWGGGLSKFDRKTKKFKSYTSTKENTDPTKISTNNCTYVVELSDGRFMVGCWEGEGFKNCFLQYFDPQTEKFQRFDVEKYAFESEGEKGGIKAALRIIHFIYPDVNGKTWVGTFLGLVCIDEETKTIRRYSGVGGQGKEAYENATECVKDNSGKLWISTEVTGIMVFDPVTKKCGYLSHEYKNSKSISGDNIASMYKDEDDNIWVTTAGGGIDIYTPLLQQFKFIGNESIKAERANRAQGQSAMVRIGYDQNSRKIYLSHGNGFTVYDPVTDSLQHVDTKEIYKKNETALGIKVNDNAGSQVIGTYDFGNKLAICNGYGLMVYDKQKRTYSFPGFKDYWIRDIQKNKYGYLATGTNKHATDWYVRLLQLDTNFKVVKEHHYPEWPFKDMLGHFNGIYITPLGEHDWYINFNGRLFYIFNEESGKFTGYCARKECGNNFPDSLLTPLAKDKNDNLWILGNNGVYKFDRRSGKSERYNDIFKIGKEQIFSLTIDSSGVFWIALKQDLVRFDPVSGESFRFTNKLGLNIGGFSKVATDPNNRNEVYILSSYGLLHFDPRELKFSKQKPDIFMSGIIINKDTMNTPAMEAFMAAEHILKYDQNHLTFEYGTYQLYTPGPKKYEYRLLGLDSTWYNNENRNYVTYQGLAPGNYTLELKCRNIYGITGNVQQFTFAIEPPFWKRWWFILCEVLVLGGIIWIFIKRRERKLEAAKLKLENTVAERTKEVVEKAKEIEMQNEIIFEKNKELTDSIKYAERIQQALLANDEFMDQNLPEHFVLFKPKAIVSGDFYWATSVSSGKKAEDGLFYLAVCDCTGHGVPGAFMSLLNISFLNEAISEKKILEPNKVLDYVRERLIESLAADKGQDGMDGTLLCYNKKGQLITYASAHNKPLLIRNGAMHELTADKMPVGKGEKNSPFTLQTVSLQKGDMIYFYSDGYGDQFGGPKGKKFKHKQLNELLFSISNKDLNTQKLLLDQVFEDWRGHLEQIDDVMVIGIRI
jgi:serine phosphatase RsbU (regulator of sigma subunit)/ligand-binding sensor domain-containing protein